MTAIPSPPATPARTACLVRTMRAQGRAPGILAAAVRTADQLMRARMHRLSSECGPEPASRAARNKCAHQRHRSRRLERRQPMMPGVDPPDRPEHVDGSANSRLLAALHYAARGWSVFPCWPGAKNPMTPHGFHDATTDRDTIIEWWRRAPDANIALPTGPSSADVLDVDVRPNGNGWSALRVLVAAGLLAGAMRTVRTPSGGLHLYFLPTGQHCGRVPGRFIDLKATGRLRPRPAEQYWRAQLLPSAREPGTDRSSRLGRCTRPTYACA